MVKCRWKINCFRLAMRNKSTTPIIGVEHKKDLNNVVLESIVYQKRVNHLCEDSIQGNK